MTLDSLVLGMEAPDIHDIGGQVVVQLLWVLCSG
jgi:hypothetical protein